MATLRLTPEFREFLKLCLAGEIEFLVVGGFAVSLHGYVRPTKDIDLWVATSPQNLDRLVAVLERWGFAAGRITPDFFTSQHTVFRIGFPPNRIEIITAIDGVTFDDCFSRRESHDLDGVEVPVISFNDLIRNKLSTGRVRDAGDAEYLNKLPRA